MESSSAGSYRPTHTWLPSAETNGSGEEDEVHGTTTSVRSGSRNGRSGATLPDRARPGALAGRSPGVRVPELVVGVMVVAGCALAALLWHTSVTATRQAVVLATAVERGHVFEEADFAPADVAATGMRLIPFAERDSLVGRLAATDLDAATPLNDSVAVPAIPLSDGDALVGRRLEAGDYPAGLAAEATVQVLLLADPVVAVDADPAGRSVTLEGTAVVDTVVPLLNAADAVVVTLRLPDGLAAQVAAADSVRLVQVGH